MSRLTRASIVDAALTLLDARGRDGLSTRALAEALGVKSPALYWHFRNMRELLDAVAAAMLSPQDWPGPPKPGLEPSDWLAARAHALRHALLAHRDGAIVHAGTVPGGPALEGLEARLEALVAWGLTPDDAVRATMAVTRFTVGWVMEEQAQRQREDRPLHPVDPVATPVLARATAVLGGGEPDADFDFGLRALVAGIASRRRAPAVAG